MFCVIILSLFVVAPPLSVDSVMAVLGGVAHNWRSVGQKLYIPDATLSYIDGECKDDLERLRRVVRYWLLKDPLASWRRLICRLYSGIVDDDLVNVADTIKEYAEKLTGQHILCQLNFVSTAYSPLDHSHLPLHLLCIGPLSCASPLTPHWTTPMCPSTYSPLDHSHVPLHLLPIGPLPCAPPLTPHWTTPMCPSTYSPLDHSHVPLHLLPIGPLHVPLHLLPIGPLPCMYPSTNSPLDHSHVPLHLLPIGPLHVPLHLLPIGPLPCMYPSTNSPLDHSHVPLHLLPIGPLDPMWLQWLRLVHLACT